MWTLNHEFDKKLQHVCMYPPEYLSGHDKTWSLSLDLYITSQQTNVLVFKCLSEISEFLIRQRFDRETCRWSYTQVYKATQTYLRDWCWEKNILLWNVEPGSSKVLGKPIVHRNWWWWFSPIVWKVEPSSICLSKVIIHESINIWG